MTFDHRVYEMSKVRRATGGGASKSTSQFVMSTTNHNSSSGRGGSRRFRIRVRLGGFGSASLRLWWWAFDTHDLAYDGVIGIEEVAPDGQHGHVGGT